MDALNSSEEGMLSFIVLTRNRLGNLEECLESLFAQDCGEDEYEIIVVDDGSNDGTRGYVESLLAGHPNLRYHHQEHGGISKARNAGLLNAAGNIIAFIADDYVLPRGYAAAAKKIFTENPACHVMRFRIKGRDSNMTEKACQHYYEVSIRNLLSLDAAAERPGFFKLLGQLFFHIPKFTDRMVISYNLPASGAASFRKEVFKKAGVFDENLKRAEDSDMGMRLNGMGIGVWYYPFISIRRSYETALSEVLKKQFFCGQCAYGFKKKNPGHPLLIPDSPKNFALCLTNIFYNPLFRARQADSLKDFFVLLPFMFLMNAAYVLGLIYKALAKSARKR